MGIETCPLPTALLSTQTDGFDTYYFRDTTSELEGILDAWKELSLHYDAIYSGFLGSEHQVQLIKWFIEQQRRVGSPLVLVDPVLGDDASLYGPITTGHVEAMRSLVHVADIITPNITEAALLLDLPFQEQFDEKEALSWARKLSLLTGSFVVITSVPLSDGFAVACHAENQDFLVRYAKVDASYPGCGDLFASILLGSLLCKHTFQTAVRRAVTYTSMAIERTKRTGRERRLGVSPTLILPDLSRERAQ
jgi:pyridoxine kinase